MLLTLKDVESFTTMPTEDTYYLQRKDKYETIQVYLVAKDTHVFWDGDISKYRANDSLAFCYKEGWYLDMDMEELVSYNKDWRLFNSEPSADDMAMDFQ